MEGKLNDREISQKVDIPHGSIRHRRWEINQLVEARNIAIASKRQIPKEDRERVQTATEKYLRLMRENQRACAPIVQALLQQVMIHATNSDDLLSPSDLNQLANAMATLQKTLRVGMNDIQQSILSLLDYEMVSIDQAEQLFTLLNQSQDDFRTSTQKVLGNYDSSRKKQASKFIGDLEKHATVDAEAVEAEESD